jgi:hypothetical protein
MDYQKMMFVLEVKKLAEAKYNQAHTEQKKTAKEKYELIIWERQHTPLSFVPEVISELNTISELIDQPPAAADQP